MNLKDIIAEHGEKAYCITLTKTQRAEGAKEYFRESGESIAEVLLRAKAENPRKKVFYVLIRTERFGYDKRIQITGEATA